MRLISARDRYLAAAAARDAAALPTTLSYGGWTQAWLDFVLMDLDARNKPHSNLLRNLQLKSFIGRADALRTLGRSPRGRLTGCTQPIDAVVRRLKKEGWIPVDAVPLLEAVYDGDVDGPLRPAVSGYRMAAGLVALKHPGGERKQSPRPDS